MHLRRTSGIVGLLILFAASTAAYAQGVAEQVVRGAITAAARGECPENLLAPMLRGACLQQMPVMGERISALGPISRIDFLGNDSLNGTPVEIYRVTHERGSLVWAAATGPDGKLVVWWTSGS
jgi:hypothetical protein